MSEREISHTAVAPIVVGIDGSEVCAAALEWAAREAARRDCPLEVITVLPAVNHDGAADMLLASAAGQFDAMLASFPLVHMRHIRLFGSPSTALVRAARHAALLVVGSQGTSPFARVLLGSVSSYCARHAE